MAATYSLNIQNSNNDGTLFSLRNIKIIKKIKKIFLGNFSADSLDSGPFFDN